MPDWFDFNLEIMCSGSEPISARHRRVYSTDRSGLFGISSVYDRLRANSTAASWHKMLGGIVR